MKWVYFAAGGVIGAIIAFAWAIKLDMDRAAAAKDDDIVFAAKNFMDFDASVGISGTLTGGDLAYKNNTHSITCFKIYQSCFVTSIEQIGLNHVSRLEYSWSYEVKKWQADEVVAQAESPCLRTTITLDRRLQKALWLEEPRNIHQPFCEKADSTIRKYTIGDSPGWKRIFGKRAD